MNIYLPLCPILKNNMRNNNNNTVLYSYHHNNFYNKYNKNIYATSPMTSENNNNIDNRKAGKARILAKMVSACVGSIITTLVVTPLDVVKVRLQAVVESSTTVVRAGVSPGACKTCSHYTFSNGLMEHVFHKSYCAHFSSEALKHSISPNSSMFAVMNRIVRTEGVAALWDGLAPTLLMAIPNTMIYMVLYDEFCHNVLPSYNFSMSTSAIVAGGAARVVSGTIVAPFELIRTQMQSSATDASEGIVKKFRSIVKKGGFTSLWRGLSPTLWRDVPFSALYWLLYEQMKTTIGTDANQSIFFTSFVSGATAGSIAAFLTTPFDVIKTRRQIDIYSTGPKTASGTFQVMGNIIKEEKISRLFTGVAPRVGKVAPACAIMISSYEIGKWYFGID